MSTLEKLSRFSVNDVLQMPIGDHVAEKIEITNELLSSLGIDIVLQGSLTFNIMHIDDGLDCEIALNGAGNITCSRCAENTKITINGLAQSYYMLKAEGDEEPIFAKKSINVVQQCIDTIVQSLPLNPLCRPGCLGVCVKCGVNINNNPKHLDQFKDHVQSDALVNSPHLEYDN